MTMVAILADQHFRRGLLATPGLLPQPLRRLQERDPFRRHVVVGRAFQDVARLAFQGAVVQRGAPLEAIHHVFVKPPHIDRHHGFASTHRIANCYHSSLPRASPGVLLHMVECPEVGGDNILTT